MLDKIAAPVSNFYYWASYFMFSLFVIRIGSRKYANIKFTIQDWPIIILVGITIALLLYVYKINEKSFVNWLMNKNYILSQIGIVATLYACTFLVVNITGIREMYLIGTKHLYVIY
jgi:hypothetical protein